MQSIVMQWNLLQCNAINCNVMKSMQCNAIYCDAMESIAMQCKSMQCNTIYAGCNALHAINDFITFKMSTVSCDVCLLCCSNVLVVHLT